MITPRLDLILQHIAGNSVADIGTDHAYIPIKLSQKGIKVVATDIRKGPLDMAKVHIEKHGCHVELRLGGGLDPISAGETDDIVIAGMGGEMIIHILSSNDEKARASRLILQPMNSQYELRKYLYENGYRIICEDLAIEGFKVYNLIVAENGESIAPDKDIDLHLPKSLYSHPLFIKLCEKKKREFTRIYSGLSASSNPDEAELSYAKDTLTAICDIIDSIENQNS